MVWPKHFVEQCGRCSLPRNKSSSDYYLGIFSRLLLFTWFYLVLVWDTPGHICYNRCFLKYEKLVLCKVLSKLLSQLTQSGPWTANVMSSAWKCCLWTLTPDLIKTFWCGLKDLIHQRAIGQLPLSWTKSFLFRIISLSSVEIQIVSI